MNQVVTHSVQESQVNSVRGTLMDSSPSSGRDGGWKAGGREGRTERILRALGSFARLSADPRGQTNLPLVDEMASLSRSHCCTVIKSANNLPQPLFTNQKYSSLICVRGAVNLMPLQVFWKKKYWAQNPGNIEKHSNNDTTYW